MTKELKALEYIENFNNKRFFDITYDNGDQAHYEYRTIKDLFPKEFGLIEAAIKRLDSIEITAIDIEQDNKALCKENKKLIRALDIIREKRVDCNTLIFYLEKHNEIGHIDYAFDSYNDYAKDSDKPQLTKEEFDRLKEALLCGY